MRKRIYRSIAIAIPLLCLITLMFPWKEQTHQNHLTRMALRLLELSTQNQEYSVEIWKRFPEFVMQGAHDEDFPLSDFIYLEPKSASTIGIRFNCRANNHYMHALGKVGLSDFPFIGRFDKDVDTLSWAKTNESFHADEEFNRGIQWHNYGWSAEDLDNGNMSWEKAINRYGYTDNAKALAYYTLGFILHLLQDMGCPEHVHDDPHGASGYTGFEMYVYREWAQLMPVVRTLRPKKFNSIDDYFNNLAMIGYSINRFQGGKQDNKQDIDQYSDLAKMFLLEYNDLQSKWIMKNKNGTAIIDRRLPSPEALILPDSTSDFEWNRKAYTASPFWHKGHDSGEFWPTSMEMHGVVGARGKDKEGFYYIELSGDIPLLGETRSLYPMAFLPTPLPQVKKQCKKWDIPELDGKTHLYEIIGKKIFPYIVEHSTGLIQHYFDIVNQPPFVKSVLISQVSTTKYHATWQDEIDRVSSKKRTTDVKSRNLEKKANRALNAGKVIVTVAFSEPVCKPRVTIAGKSLTKLSSDYEDSIWSGFYEIPERGPEKESLHISISTLDKNNHFGGTGGALDRNPGSPAKRLSRSGQYRWINYDAGADTNHIFVVQREKSEDISREHFIPGTWDWYVGNTLFGYVVITGGGRSGSMISYNTEGKEINSGNWRFDEATNRFILKWDIGRWVDKLSLSKNGMILSGSNNAGSGIMGKIRKKK